VLKFHPLVIADRRPIADDAIALTFAVPAGLDDAFAWVVRRFINMVPDVEAFGWTSYVSEGFSIPLECLLMNVVVTLNRLTNGNGGAGGGGGGAFGGDGGSGSDGAGTGHGVKGDKGGSGKGGGTTIPTTGGSTGRHTVDPVTVERTDGGHRRPVERGSARGRGAAAPRGAQAFGLRGAALRAEGGGLPPREA